MGMQNWMVWYILLHDVVEYICNESVILVRVQLQLNSSDFRPVRGAPLGRLLCVAVFSRFSPDKNDNITIMAEYPFVKQSNSLLFHEGSICICETLRIFKEQFKLYCSANNLIVNNPVFRTVLVILSMVKVMPSVISDSWILVIIVANIIDSEGTIFKRRSRYIVKIINLHVTWPSSVIS